MTLIAITGAVEVVVAKTDETPADVLLTVFVVECVV